MDFRNASRLFADKNFDGNPEVVIDITDNDPINPVTGNENGADDSEDDTDTNSGNESTGNTGDSGNDWGNGDDSEKPKNIISRM